MKPRLVLLLVGGFCCSLVWAASPAATGPGIGLPTMVAGFLVAGAAVTVAGVFLTKAGDELGDKLNLGGSWVGLVVLSAVTSMPELVATVSSAAWQGQPDLAAGNIFGSNCFNVFIIALLDAYYRGRSLTYQFGTFPALSAGLGIMMTTVGALVILASQQSIFHSSPVPSWGWSLLLLVGYTVSMLLVYLQEKRLLAKEKEKLAAEGRVNSEIISNEPLRPTLVRLGWSSAVVVVAGLAMVFLADRLAVYPFTFGQLGHSFIGTLGLACATSLPELVVGTTAIRMARFDLAAGNIFGSNIFNIMILVICQLVYAPVVGGSFYQEIGVGNLVSALLAVVLASIAIVGMMFRSKRTWLGMGWDSVVITIVYGAGIYLVWLGGHA